MAEQWMKQLAETVGQQQEQIKSLVEALQGMLGVQEPVRVNVEPPVVADAVARAEKVQKLALNMRKSNRFKPFKVTSDSDVKLFLKKFDEELQSLKSMVGIGNALTKEEFVPILKASLDFSVIERVNQVLTNTDNTWGGDFYC